METFQEFASDELIVCEYFLSFKEYTNEKPFDPSLMVRFRKRFSTEKLNAFNENICKRDKKDDDELSATGGSINQEVSSKEAPNNPLSNKGKLIVDATCVPADIRYPSDLGLLNEAREKTESYIDILYEPLRGRVDKPCTYRKIVRNNYLATAKMRKPRKKQLRWALRKQLGYVHRNLKNIEQLEKYCMDINATIEVIQKEVKRQGKVIHFQQNPVSFR